MANKITIKKAASIMGVSELYVREAISQRVLPIGCCIKGKNGKRSFYISPVKFAEWTGYREEGSDEEG